MVIHDEQPLLKLLTRFFKKKKISHEKSRNSPALRVDRISQLPDEVILHIFSFIPTESLIPTSTLSRRWKNLWKELQNLKFDSKKHQNNFSDHVVSALLSYRNPSFNSLTIGVWDHCGPLDLAIWVSIALVKNVCKLVLKLNELVDPVVFPYRVLGYPNRLEILKLMGKLHFNLPSTNATFDCLKKLHLYYVRFDDEETVSHLLNGFPLLEDLIIHIYISSGVNTLIVSSLSIQRLVFGSHECQAENLSIQTPNLKFLDMQRFDGVESCVIEHAHNLAEAKISYATDGMDDNILSSITSVQSLNLCSSIKFPMTKVFHNLTTLEVDTRMAVWCNLLAFMFSCSPKLQSLKVVGGMYTRLDTKWTEPQCVAQSMEASLIQLEWAEFNWNEEDDRNVAIYILNNAAVLKNATLTILEPTILNQTQEREDTVNLLSNTARASHSCHLVITESTFWTDSPSNDTDSDLVEFSY